MTSADHCRFEYEALNAGDATYEHDYTVNIGEYTVTYCIQLKFQNYKQGECIGIKSLLPGQKISQRRIATYSKVVYDEAGKQVAMADSTTAESELLSNVSTNLSNLAHSSETTTTRSNWNAGGGASGGFDFLVVSFSLGGEGGGGGSEEDVITNVSEMFESIVTNSVSKTKNSKASSNLATFNALHTTTVSQSDTTDTIDVIENLSKSKIAMYHFYTMHKKYECRQFIKHISTNRTIRRISHYNTALFPAFLPHKSNQTSNLDTLAKIIPLCKDPSEIIKLNALIGENGLIGTNGVTVESRRLDVVNTANDTLIGPNEFRNRFAHSPVEPPTTHATSQPPADFVTKGAMDARTLPSSAWASLNDAVTTLNIRTAALESADFGSAVASLLKIAAHSPQTTLDPTSQLHLTRGTSLLCGYAGQTDPVSQSQIATFVDTVRRLEESTASVKSSSPTAGVTSIAELMSTLQKTTTILLPIDGFYIKGENTCEMKFTTNKEIEGL